MTAALPTSFFLVFVFVLQWIRQRMRSSLPPGPRGWPLIGNVLDMPKEKDWLTYADWGRKYGPIVSVNLLGQTLVLINSGDLVSELEKKGALYSDRPRLEMAGELIGHGKVVVLLSYNAQFRNHRKHIARLMGSASAIQKYLPMIDVEVRRHLNRVLGNPSGLVESLRKLSGAIILKMTYGIDVQDEDDPYVNLINESNEIFFKTSKPGAYLVDILPIMHRIPEWFPGGGFKRSAREWAKVFQSVVNVPFEFTKSQMRVGQAPPSFIADSLSDEDELSASDIADIKYSAAGLYGAGADTAVSALTAFYLAMVLSPDVQAKAQAEIDAVVGQRRLPNIADRDKLPYVNAIVTEVLRWSPVTPMGFPHVTKEDSHLGGFLIPKGAAILINVWQMTHDPDVYPNPSAFQPERYLGENPQRDPRLVCFGFGRRTCPGSLLAEATMFIAIATTLATFDISPVMENGVPLIPMHEMTSGTVVHPKPFDYVMKPRSAAAEALVVNAL